MRPNTHATTWGDWVERETQELREELEREQRTIDIAFVGGNGFDLGSGITMGTMSELGFKRFALENAAEPYIVADGSKAGIALPSGDRILGRPTHAADECPASCGGSASGRASPFGTHRRGAGVTIRTVTLSTGFDHDVVVDRIDSGAVGPS